MASRDIKLCRPEIQEMYLAVLAAYSATPDAPQPFVTNTQRTAAEQDADYAQGRTTAGKVITNANSSNSPHCTQPLSSAIDFAFKNPNGTLNWSEQLFLGLNTVIQTKYPNMFTWGGNFHTISDGDHWELADWKAYRDNQENDAA